MKVSAQIPTCQYGFILLEEDTMDAEGTIKKFVKFTADYYNAPATEMENRKKEKDSPLKTADDKANESIGVMKQWKSGELEFRLRRKDKVLYMEQWKNGKWIKLSQEEDHV